ncbi:MAG: carboxymuconolactone decarboxylase family protein [Rhodobacter sp.]|nr:carboxymuconolactone decarboxylase family protein [Rhodobacter sp.]
MTAAAPHNALSVGRELSEQVMPGLEAALAKKYDRFLPGFSEWQIATVYGGPYARDGVSAKTRQIATVAALTAMGAQTAPQLKIHIKAALDAGWSAREISEIILQMALYGGFPAAINALNAAIEVFEAENTAEGDA